MSFSLRNLSVLAYSNGFTLWLYQAAQDDRSSVMSEAFFEDAGDMLTQGDMVMVSSLGGGLLLSVLSHHPGIRTSPIH